MESLNNLKMKYIVFLVCEDINTKATKIESKIPVTSEIKRLGKLYFDIKIGQ